MFCSLLVWCFVSKLYRKYPFVCILVMKWSYKGKKLLFSYCCFYYIIFLFTPMLCINNELPKCVLLFIAIDKSDYYLFLDWIFKFPLLAASPMAATVSVLKTVITSPDFFAKKHFILGVWSLSFSYAVKTHICSVTLRNCY